MFSIIHESGGVVKIVKGLETLIMRGGCEVAVGWGGGGGGGGCCPMTNKM